MSDSVRVFDTHCVSLCAGLGDCVNLCVCVYLRVHECFLVFVFVIDETNREGAENKGQNEAKPQKTKNKRRKKIKEARYS